MSTATQKTRRYFIKITEGLKEQDAEDSHKGTFNGRSICCKKRAEKAAEENNREDRKTAAECGQEQTLFQDVLASVNLAGSIVLTAKGSRCLSECRNNIVSEVFKVHSYGASGDGTFSKAVDRCLYKEIGKAENSTLQSRWDTGFQDRPDDLQGKIWSAEGKLKELIIFQAMQQDKRRE